MAFTELFGVITEAFEFIERFGSFDRKTIVLSTTWINEWAWLCGCGYNGHTNMIWLPTLLMNEKMQEFLKLAQEKEEAIPPLHGFLWCPPIGGNLGLWTLWRWRRRSQNHSRLETHNLWPKHGRSAIITFIYFM